MRASFQITIKGFKPGKQTKYTRRTVRNCKLWKCVGETLQKECCSCKEGTLKYKTMLAEIFFQPIKHYARFQNLVVMPEPGNVLHFCKKYWQKTFSIHWPTDFGSKAYNDI